MSDRIKALRNERGVGQNKPSKDICVRNFSISYWETGKQEPSAEAVFKLAQYFDFSADFISGLIDY